MPLEQKTLSEFTVKELDRELLARGGRVSADEMFQFQDGEGTPSRFNLMEQTREIYKNPIPLNPLLDYVSTWTLTRELLFKIGRIVIDDRAIWGEDQREDVFDLQDPQVIENAHSTAAICLDDNLIPLENDFSALKVKNYGKTFNLCPLEPFFDQPVSEGKMCTGILAAGDLILTAAHFFNEREIQNLRIIFGFKMTGPGSPEIKIPNENIYRATGIVGKVYKGRSNGPDWALLKLDRNVKSRPARLSVNGISYNQEVYVLGYPLGLPLKYAPGAYIRDIKETCFTADLDVYSGNSGSPVFSAETHEMLGIVVRGAYNDFRWTEKGWISAYYPNPVTTSLGSDCTRASEFITVIEGK